jgi:predicted lipoprotein with Yx(FWY)xxD motif
MIRRILVLATAVTAALLVLTAAGCGSDDPDAARPAGTHKATIDVAKGDLGSILVDSRERTLYLFERDSGTTSTCSGECATQWPPVRADAEPTVGSGLTASKIATTPRPDGQLQVTYNGHPLYTFAGDNNAGDTSGQGINAFGGKWFVVSPAGDEIASTGAGNGGNGY